MSRLHYFIKVLFSLAIYSVSIIISLKLGSELDNYKYIIFNFFGVLAGYSIKTVWSCSTTNKTEPKDLNSTYTTNTYEFK